MHYVLPPVTSACQGSSESPAWAQRHNSSSVVKAVKTDSVWAFLMLPSLGQPVCGPWSDGHPRSSGGALQHALAARWLPIRRRRPAPRLPS
jgi:hypothetical protein